MPYVYNRRAFGGVVRYLFGPEHDDSLPLLVLYCAFVRLELALKDHDPRFRSKGHKVCEMLTALGVNASLVVQLSNRLDKFWCISKTGSQAPVRADRYPDLRYLCHESDFAGRTTTIQLKDAIDIVHDIEQELINKGIAL